MSGNTQIKQYTLRNKVGMEVRILNYGGIITDILVADRNNIFENVVLGFQDIEDYKKKNSPYFGAIVGRYANRISNGCFRMGDTLYTLSRNNNGNTLHGGATGFDKVFWNVLSISENQLVMAYESPDGEEGFPGNLKVEIQFTVSESNKLTLEYKATTDKPTPVSLTSHPYFNLSAGKCSTIIDHELQICSNRITEVDEALLPTGKFLEVRGTPFDFDKSKIIGSDIEKVTGGYDHNYVLEKVSEPGNSLRNYAAQLYDPVSGRQMRLNTSEPGLQFYSGNFLDGTIIGKNNQVYIKHAGLCLEPQQFPDSPNQPNFPNVFLLPGEIYRQVSEYEFSTR